MVQPGMFVCLFYNENSGYTIVSMQGLVNFMDSRWRTFLTSNCVLMLRNDPDKNCSVFYCSAAIHFPHIETVLISYREFINRWKAGFWNKMYLISILEGTCLWAKTLPITTVADKDNKSVQFSNVPHIGLLWYLDSEEILLKGRL